jgi:hypothetical protein
MKSVFRMFCVLAALLIAGCTTVRYEYQPPSSDTGRLCVTQCQGIREVCRGNEINRAQAERYACEQRSEMAYRGCYRNARSPDEARRCYRPACNIPDTQWRCDERFRQCFEGCGGVIRKFTQ